MNWKTVFFDFDGVILDSVDVKTNAFGKMFSKYGSEIESAVRSYHLANTGVSRFDKFRYYYDSLLFQPIDDELLAKLSAEFSAIAFAEVVAAQFMPGALEALEQLKKASVPMYIVSATPETEMQTIVKERGLEKYFDEVHGSPRKKYEIVREIVSRKKLDAQKCLFIGDAISDYKAAQETGVSFLGIIKTISPFPSGTWISKEVTACLKEKK
jgi:HAD superfamily hydrolase (TIGR01549 family)